jgi:hypothetical protein
VNQFDEQSISKLKLTLKRAPAPDLNQVIALEKWRTLFFRLGLIGENPTKKIGYGNLSSRLNSKSFIITGSQTGHLSQLQSHHYTSVIDCDLKKSILTAEGLIPPCRDSLTHSKIYIAHPHINYIFQVHHKNLMMTGSLENMSNTSGQIIFNKNQDVLFSVAATAEEAGKNILDIYRKLTIMQ